VDSDRGVQERDSARNGLRPYGLRATVNVIFQRHVLLIRRAETSRHYGSHSQTEGTMEKEQALKILNALANGIHPATGEVFAADSAYQHPDTVRALFEAVRAIEGNAAAAGTEKRNSDMPASPFVRWTPQEEERLAAGFDAGKTSAELARLHNRSRAAIEARLLKLGKIDASALTVQLRYGAKGGEGAHSPG
jgi:hypothetical protein